MSLVAGLLKVSPCQNLFRNKAYFWQLFMASVWSINSFVLVWFWLILTGPSNDLYMFDTQHSLWVNFSGLQTGPVPTPRWSHGLTSLNGKLYVYGGFTDPSSSDKGEGLNEWFLLFTYFLLVFRSFCVLSAHCSLFSRRGDLMPFVLSLRSVCWSFSVRSLHILLDFADRWATGAWAFSLCNVWIRCMQFKTCDLCRLEDFSWWTARSLQRSFCNWDTKRSCCSQTPNCCFFHWHLRLGCFDVWEKLFPRPQYWPLHAGGSLFSIILRRK